MRVVRARRPAILALLLLSCAGAPPATLGLQGRVLHPCPPSPNCVSSDATDPEHAVAPFELAAGASEAWEIAGAAVSDLPRTVIVSRTSDYLHAECTSALLGFVDDLELHLRGSEGAIAVRSASRVGYGDMGVNRERVEALRARLVEAGAVREPDTPDGR